MRDSHGAKRYTCILFWIWIILLFSKLRIPPGKKIFYSRITVSMNELREGFALQMTNCNSFEFWWILIKILLSSL